MTKKPKTRKRRRKGRYKRGIHVSTKTGASCKYRSGWELAYLKHLDDNVMVKTFGYESVKIPYISNVRSGKLRNYLPDFLVEYVDGTSQLVEIKPKRKVAHVTVQKKLKAAQEWCNAHSVSLVVITEVELKAMGLL